MIVYCKTFNSLYEKDRNN